MFAALLGGALALGQPPAPPPPAPPAPRWAVMESAQGTWLGALLDDHRLSVSGWTDLTATASTARRDQLPVGFNYLADSALLQQNWLRLERTVDDKAATPTWGFRGDIILPGADYRFTLARGLADSQLTSNAGRPEVYGVDPVQFYAELYLPQVGRGLDLKAGRFFAQFGVESIDTTQNALFSHSHTFIYDPFTHTGLLATQKLTDAWSVQNGVVTGSDVFLDSAASPTYLGSVKWAPPTGRTSALFAVILGSGRYDESEAFSNPQVLDLVLTHKLSDRTTYTLDALYSFQRGVPGRGFVDNWGVVQYLTHQLAPTVSGTARLELFGDPQGFKTGTEGLYTAATAGVTYKPLPWLWLRPEVRYDHCADGRPFEGRADVFTATLDLLVRW